MGAVLAMSSISNLTRAAGALVALALLAACGTARDEALPKLITGLASRANDGAPATADQVRAQITPEFLAQVTQPLLMAEIPSRDALATLVPIGVNGSWQSWASPDGVGLTLSRGILGATRGLGYDLLGADLTGVSGAIAAGQGTATRVHSFLDGENQVDQRIWTCRYVAEGRETITLTGGAQHATTRVQETCTPNGAGTGFENTYWRGTGDGVIRQSRQWAGPQSGYVLLQQLRD